ncbi:DUF929 family protein [Acidihalobacter prosperus]
MRHFFIFTLARPAILATMLILPSLPAQASRQPTKLDQPLGSRIIKNLKKASHLGLEVTQAPDYTSMQSLNGPNPAKKSGKTTVLYVGADYCPFCGALRWPLTLALMRFGSFSNLRTMRSSPKDVYPNTATMSYAKVKYKSHYVDFTPVETSDRMGHPLEPLKGESAKLFHKFDSAPYTGHADGIPFLYIGGEWLLLGAPVNPKIYANLNWSQITKQLSQPKSKLARLVMPQANLITAAICQTTNQKPHKICQSAGVKAAAGMLPPMS